MLVPLRNKQFSLIGFDDMKGGDESSANMALVEHFGTPVIMIDG